jgi:hypothetical protein
LYALRLLVHFIKLAGVSASGNEVVKAHGVFLPAFVSLLLPAFYPSYQG